MKARALAIVLITLAVSASPHPAIAQIAGGPRAGLSQPAAALAHRQTSDAPARSVTANQWQKGALIGGAVGAGLGLLFKAFEDALDDRHDAHLSVFIGTTLICALIGGMIGSFSPKA